jgi:hypothetical protein
MENKKEEIQQNIITKITDKNIQVCWTVISHLICFGIVFFLSIIAIIDPLNSKAT